MAKFKRFDPKNRKARQHNTYGEDYTARQRHNDYIKRKIEYDEQRQYGDDDADSRFQPQRTGVRL